MQTLPIFPASSAATAYIPLSVDGTRPSHRELSRTLMVLFVHIRFPLVSFAQSSALDPSTYETLLFTFSQVKCHQLSSSREHGTLSSMYL